MNYPELATVNDRSDDENIIKASLCLRKSLLRKFCLFLLGKAGKTYTNFDYVTVKVPS